MSDSRPKCALLCENLDVFTFPKGVYPGEQALLKHGTANGSLAQALQREGLHVSEARRG